MTHIKTLHTGCYIITALCKKFDLYPTFNTNYLNLNKLNTFSVSLYVCKTVSAKKKFDKVIKLYF